MNSDYSLFGNVVLNETTSCDIENPNSVSIIDTSEPERLVLYRSIVQETLRKITASISADKLVEAFKEFPPFDRKYHAINKVHNVLTTQMHDQINKQVDLQIKSENLLEKFTILEELIKANSEKSDTSVWRPTHSVESNLRSYIMKEKLKYKEQLKHLVSQKEATVNKLKYDVIADRNRLKSIEERMQTVEEKLTSLYANAEIIRSFQE